MRKSKGQIKDGRVVVVRLPLCCIMSRHCGGTVCVCEFLWFPYSVVMPCFCEVTLYGCSVVGQALEREVVMLNFHPVSDIDWGLLNCHNPFRTHLWQKHSTQYLWV